MAYKTLPIWLSLPPSPLWSCPCVIVPCSSSFCYKFQLFSERLDPLLPQSLCTCCSICFHALPSHKYLQSWLSHCLLGFCQMSLFLEGHIWLPTKKKRYSLFVGGIFSSAQSLSRVPLFATLWIAARQASLSITNSWSSLKLMSIESVMPSSHLILCRSLFLLPPIPPSIRVFSNESTLHIRWPEYWSFSFSIIHSKEHPGLISFRMDWLEFLAVQGTLKSLLQDHSSKASILQHSAFFTV